MSKTIPHSIEAEQCVLGAMLVDNQTIDRITDKLCVDDFYISQHQGLYKLFSTLHRDKRPVDIVTTADTTTDRLYVVNLIEMLPSTANVGYYIRIVKEKSLRRAVIRSCQTLTEEAHSEDDVSVLLEEAQKKFIGLNVDDGKKYTTIKELAKEGFEELERLHTSDLDMTGISSGLSTLDNFVGGFQKQDLIVIAGRPSMGKSSLALQVATANAMDGKRVGFFSAETGNRQIMKNIFARQAKIDTTKFRNGCFYEDDWDKIVGVINQVVGVSFFMDDRIRSSKDVVKQARKIYVDHGLDIIFVDHIHRLYEGGRQESRNHELGVISGNLKALAMELNIPVIAVAQLSRNVEHRGGDFKPRMSDLRDSGNIEQDADVIMLIHREGYYHPEDIGKEHKAEVVIAKHRNGPTGLINLHWSPSYLAFEEVIGDY